MEFSLSEVQEMFKSTARKFFKEKCTVSSLRASETSFSPDLYKEITDLGFLGLLIPEEYGGAGGSLMDLALVIEEAGRAALPSPFVSTIMYGLIPILQYGTEKQKQELLPRIAQGELIFTGALSEQQAHYDLKHIRTSAAKTGGEYSLSGTKLFVPYAQSAHYMLTLARTTETHDRNDEGLSLFLIDSKQAGVSSSALSSIGSDQLFEVNFQNVQLSEISILGEGNNGWPLTQQIIQTATALQCIEMVGVLERALEVTNEYVKERVQFGRPIGTYQAVQHRLSDMFTIVEGGRLAAYHAISRLEAGLSAEKEISTAKTWLSKEGQHVLTGAHQLHGGMGIDMDYPLQFCFRRFKSMQVTLGSAPVHLEKIGKLLAPEPLPKIKRESYKYTV